MGRRCTVVPVDWPSYAKQMGVQRDDAFGQALTKVLQNEARYELQWVAADHDIVKNIRGWEGVECYYPKFSSFGYEQAVRPLAGFAYGMAALLKTGIYSPSVAGQSQTEAIHRVELAIRGAALTNVANTGAGYRWGQGLSAAQSWEAAYWAGMTADAAWWLWDDLRRETQRAVANMVVHDADAFLEYTVRYWADKDGRILTPGDTKAEENAWNSHLLAAAQAMMPNHPHAARWRQKASDTSS